MIDLSGVEVDGHLHRRLVAQSHLHEAVARPDIHTVDERNVDGIAFLPRSFRGLRRGNERGYSLIELLAVTVVLLVLASAVMPLAKVTVQRAREAELRRSLREMRTALDKFKDAVDQGLIPSTELEPANEGYPPDLETLVEGVSVANDASGRKLKFLRRIPVDPMTKDEWGLRSYQDDPDATSWGGQNVFDVYTKSDGTALDGTKYKDW